jgi:c(7)-type cytochrome triheme protein
MKLLWITLTAAIICYSIPVAALQIKDKTFTTADAGKVVFSHDKHLKKKSTKSPNISCKACHNSAMEKGVHYTMAEMEQGKSCGQCHNGQTAFALDRCTVCHKVKDITYKVKATGPVLFKHSVHLQKNSDCGACHNSLFKTAGVNPPVGMAAMEKGASCGACHNGEKAFAVAECSRCHPSREIIFIDKTAGNICFSHKNHTNLYKCGECHPLTFKTSRSKTKVSMKMMEAGKSCGSCHDGKIAFSVKENCASCHKISG